jgi:HEAT repeat protein
MYRYALAAFLLCGLAHVSCASASPRDPAGSVREAVERLQDPDPLVRMHAMKALAMAQARHYAAEFAALLDDPNPLVRERALGMFIRQDNASAYAGEAAVLLGHPEAQVRCIGMRALAGVRAAGYVDQIVALLSDPASCSVTDARGEQRVTTVGAVAAETLRALQTERLRTP